MLQLHGPSTEIILSVGMMQTFQVNIELLQAVRQNWCQVINIEQNSIILYCLPTFSIKLSID